MIQSVLLDILKLCGNIKESWICAQQDYSKVLIKRALSLSLADAHSPYTTPYLLKGNRTPWSKTPGLGLVPWVAGLSPRGSTSN